MDFVFDACALIAFLRGEQGSETIESLLIDDRNNCVVHSINLCEVFYDFIKSSDENVALSALSDLKDVGLICREDMDESLWQDAGRFKAIQKASRESISLADAFAIALSIRQNAELITSDHSEFEPVLKGGKIPVKITFFR